jgi:coatomer subunit beta'
MHLRVFNYNTHEKVTAYEAHHDYIRALAIHPTQSLVLSCGDDMAIKLWDWDKQWKCMQTFEGHSHYVMCIVFNPKDPNTFATASLDKSIKVDF